MPDFESAQPLWYEIDGKDILRALSPNWLEFVDANDGRELSARNVLGRSLWDYIHGQETITLYQLLLAHVRDTRAPVTFSYRCDSPDLRRFMIMDLIPLESRYVRFSSTMARSEPRDGKIHLAYLTSGARSLVLRCSLCNRLRTKAEWMDVAEAISQGEILNTEHSIQIAYAICQSCGVNISEKSFRRPLAPPGE